MQHNLKHIVTVPSENLRKPENEVSVIVEERMGVSQQVAEVVDGIQRSYREQQRGKKHTQALLLFSLMVGDGVLLITILTFVSVMIPFLHLQLRVAESNLINWDIELVSISLVLLLWSVAAKITNAYERLYASYRFRSSLSVSFTLTLVFIFWMVLTSPFFINDISRYIKIASLFFIVAIPTLIFWRVLFAEIMSLPRFRRQAVIIGTTIAGKTIVKELYSTKRPYAAILGYISEDTGVPLQEDGIPILGGRSVLRRLGQNGMIDMIIIAIDYHKCPGLVQDAIEMAHLGISVVPMAIAYEDANGKIPVEHVGDHWYLAMPLNVVVSSLYLCWRKAIDVIFGLVGTAVLLLILPILALLIYLDSSGPIFYSQERLGIRGKPFRIYKFRSMYANAEHNGRAVWATENDARVTRVGRFMRMFHLDEFPQVLNILRGDMSLIGPRPEREEFAVKLERNIPFFRCRLAVKPGLTGWAQVKYHYASSDDDTLIKLQYDLYYIKHQSFMLDIFILLMTFAEVFLHRGT
jgi:exopolysaccharide biosynthesis polyprenyl glycosylphosphotransferase